jgi:hypothetical protein
MSEIIFAEGMKAYKPRDKAPDWVKADLVFTVTEFMDFLLNHAKPDGTVRIQIKEGKTGNYYAALDQWTSGVNPDPSKRSTDEEVAEGAPF